MTSPVSENRTNWVEPISQLARRMLHTLTVQYQDKLGVSLAAATLLKAIHSKPTDHWTQSQMANDLCLSESNVCTLIERLRMQGLLERKRLEVDRRKTQLRLTHAGDELVSRICDIDFDVSAVIAAQFHETDSEDWQQTLTRISDVLAHIDTTVGKLEREAA